MSKSPELSRELAILLNTMALNMGGRLDPIQALKAAEKQIDSLEEHGNHCWPDSVNKSTNTSNDTRRSPSRNGNRKTEYASN